jgi:hypothetical protein
VRPFACPRPVVAGGPALLHALDPVSLMTDHYKLGRRALPYRTGGSYHGLGGRYASRAASTCSAIEILVRALWATMRRLSAGLIPTANKIFPPLRRSLHHAAPIIPPTHSDTI